MQDQDGPTAPDLRHQSQGRAAGGRANQDRAGSGDPVRADIIRELPGDDLSGVEADLRGGEINEQA